MRCVIAASLMAAGLVAAIAAPRPVLAEEAMPAVDWSFSGPFGGYDLASAQRGFLVYQNVCANCHSMHLLHYRDLAGIGLDDEQIKAIAASVQVPSLDDSGQPTEVPGTPASQFRSPYPNELAARAALNGAYPPDLSVIANAREGGATYIYALMTGYGEPPADMKMGDGMYYNQYFPGHQIAMPQPLQDESVTYTDNVKPTLDQESHDVATFLTWAANPYMTERKRMGVHVVLFLLFMAGVTYGVKRKVWSDLH
jgi:ubiquinol-cytochrome c reductase cytochrome c1 subunit